MSEQNKGFEQSAISAYFYSLPIPTKNEREFLDQLNPVRAYNIFKQLASKTTNESDTLSSLILNADFSSLNAMSDLHLTEPEERNNLLGIKDGIYMFLGINELIRQFRLRDKAFANTVLPEPLLPATESELDLIYKMQTNFDYDETLTENPYRTFEDYMRYTIQAQSIFDLLSKIMESRINIINITNDSTIRAAYTIGFGNSLEDLAEISMKLFIRRQVNELEREISE